MAVIAILTPSRGRPQRFAEMVDAVFATADSPVRIYCGLDSDDPTRDTYVTLLSEYLGGPDHRVAIYTRPHMRMAGWTNWLANCALCQTSTSVLAFFGDDHRPRTNGWNTRVLEAFADLGAGLVYTRDGLQDQRLPTAPFWSANIIRALGWFYPPALRHMYADDYWLRLAQDLDRCAYLPDVLIEHMHPSAGKADMDDVYRANDTHIDHDRDAFHRFVTEEHPAILQQLRADGF